MMLKDGMILYHGSYARVENIDLSKSSANKDFGKGFYLTHDEAQARNFIKTSLLKAKALEIISGEQNYGYVSVFRYHEPKEAIKSFEFERSSKEWLWFIASNRRSKLAKELRPSIDNSLFDSDIVIGKIANDTTNPVITTYLNGLFGDIKSDVAINFAIQQLMPEHLLEQFCFRTEKAIACLEFLEATRYEL